MYTVEDTRLKNSNDPNLWYCDHISKLSDKSLDFRTGPYLEDLLKCTEILRFNPTLLNLKNFKSFILKQIELGSILYNFTNI